MFLTDVPPIKFVKKMKSTRPVWNTPGNLITSFWPHCGVHTAESEWPLKNLKMPLHRFQGAGAAGLRELARPGCTHVGGTTKVETTVCSGLGGSRRYHIVTRVQLGSQAKSAAFPISWPLLSLWLLLTGHRGSSCSLLPLQALPLL